MNRVRHSGFTLLEVVLAVTILGLVIGAITATWHAGLNGWKRSAGISDSFQRERIVMGTLEDLTKSIVFAPSKDMLYDISFTHDQQAGDSVSFVTGSDMLLPPAESTTAGFRRVTIGLQRDQYNRSYLGIANALFEHLSAKLPISRLQRDLTDSTVLRNIGVPIAHTLISLKSIDKGLSKLLLNEAKIKSDLNDNWAVAAEAIQTILRREGYPKPYEKLKELTRGTHITEQSIKDFIETLDVSEGIKTELRKISPFTYTGI